jgi:hypothetical protein
VSIEIIDGPPFRQDDQQSTFHWSAKRMQHIMRLKEEAIKVSQKLWADFIWVFQINNTYCNNNYWHFYKMAGFCVNSSLTQMYSS